MDECDSEMYCAEIGETTTENSIFTLPPDGWVTNGSDNCPDISNDQLDYDSDTEGAA